MEAMIQSAPCEFLSSETVYDPPHSGARGVQYAAHNLAYRKRYSSPITRSIYGVVRGSENWTVIQTDIAIVEQVYSGDYQIASTGQ